MLFIVSIDVVITWTIVATTPDIFDIESLILRPSRDISDENEKTIPKSEPPKRDILDRIFFDCFRELFVDSSCFSATTASDENIVIIGPSAFWTNPDEAPTIQLSRVFPGSSPKYPANGIMTGLHLYKCQFSFISSIFPESCA